MINPEVVGIEGKQDGDEGCLSFPGIFFNVERNLRAIVRAHDVNGKEFELDGTELTAVACCTKRITATASSFSTR